MASKQRWVQEITATWRKSLESILDTGRLLIEAKEKLDPGEFLEMIVRDLPFGERTAQRLMAIARDERLTDATHGSLLRRTGGR
jgi:hypothetical protein